MALKITRSDEVIRVDTLCMTIYSQPGLGKTSLSFTASRPLLLDFDKGAPGRGSQGCGSSVGLVRCGQHQRRRRGGS